MDIIEKLAEEFNLKLGHVSSAVEMMDEGNTIPFIARYRKEMTGSMTDEILRDLSEKLTFYRNLQERKEDAIRLIGETGELTDEIEKSILEAKTVTEVDDIYLPFRPKRRTRATVAEELGYGPAGDYAMSADSDYSSLVQMVEEVIQEAEEEISLEEGLAYVNDYIAGKAAKDGEIRGYIRDKGKFTGDLITTATKEAEENGLFSNYYDYSEKIRTAPSHRILAINRGEEEGQISVRVNLDKGGDLIKIAEKYNLSSDEEVRKLVDEAIQDSYDRLIHPAISNQIRAELTESASDASILVFAENLRPYLMQSPVKGRVIMGLDPAFRTGCKVAVISEFGEYLDSANIFPVEPRADVKGSVATLKRLIEKYDVDIIALGNGTASRETELFLTEHLLPVLGKKVSYTIVNESGASVYSASKLAGEEFPDLDVTIRGAISIARRVQDPMAELVKIEPKHIGVGQYQHDVNQKDLEESLFGVVESCVNAVGVDINTSSKSLLSYVAGISARNAESILEYKREVGVIKSKEELKKVKGIGPKTFEQCAGFMRVPESDNPLDNTGVHPESYKAATALLDRDLDKIDLRETAQELELGIPTLEDIIHELKKPGRDPREEGQSPVLRQDVLSMDDLEEGMTLTGTVRNVVDFGAFVDIGVGTDGLIHISNLSKSFVKHPSDIVKVSDEVEVQVIDVDKKKERIGLKRID